MKKIWKFNEPDEILINRLVEKFNVSSLVAKVLVNRGFKDDEKTYKFLHPSLDQLYDPFLMKDMDKAIKRTMEAIKNNQKITIYGDYDVDGITSITIMKQFFKDINVEVDTYMPNRLDEGYGLNKVAIQKIKNSGTQLIITVDCGISAFEEVEFINSLDIDIIITDHHECPEILPNSFAIVNPKQIACKYPFKSLAGCGVAFKFITALSQSLGMEKETYLKYLDIACVGTIADIVPLLDENRVIARFGLEKINFTKNIGLKALIDSVGFTRIDSYTIGFGVSPRINACGRMGEAEKALKLLLTQDQDEATVLAEELNKYNKHRQDIEKTTFEQVIEKIENQKLYENKIIIVEGNNWHHGVVGIVASRVVETYYKPCILISFDENEGSGSGRSISGFDLQKALEHCGKYLKKYGGHELAAGLTIDKNNYDNFKQMLIEYTKSIINISLSPVVNVDVSVSGKEININTIDEISLLEPFGQENYPPIFIYKNIKVDAIRTLSNDKHLKLNVIDGNNAFECIGFNLGCRKEEIRCGDRVDILHYMEINRFRGIEKVQLNIKDIKKS